MPLTSPALWLALTITTQSSVIKDDWHRVTSEAGGFSVEVPGKVEQRSLKQDDGTADIAMLIAQAAGVKFIVTNTESKDPVTDDKQDALFDDLKKSYATANGRTLKREQRGGKLHGMPICFFNVTATGPDGKARNEQTRFLIGDPTHLLSLQVIVPKGIEVNDDIRRFFNSLQYQPGAAQPAAKPKAESSRPTPPSVATPHRPGPPGGMVRPAPSGAVSMLKWRPLSPVGKGFAVLLPFEFKHKNSDLPDGSIKIDSYNAESGDRVFSAVAYEFPRGVAKLTPAETVQTLCKDIVTGMSAMSVVVRPLPGSDLAGHEVTFQFNVPGKPHPFDGRLRGFVQENNAYAMIYGGPAGTGGDADVMKFLESFHTTAGTGPKSRPKGQP